jgi:tRNA A37 threonylcarbamoyladenosine modification protein TsaB
LEAQIHGISSPVLSCHDARRDRAYVQILNAGARKLEPKMIDLTIEGISELSLPRGINVTGDVTESISQFSDVSVVAPNFHMIEGMAHIAASRIGYDNQRPAPLYLRAADAAPPRDQPPTIIP